MRMECEIINGQMLSWYLQNILPLNHISELLWHWLTATIKQKVNSRKAGMAKVAGSSKMKVKDTLFQDMQPGEGPQLEKEIIEANALNKQVKKVLLGSVHYDVLENSKLLQFGLWNPHQLVPAQSTIEDRLYMLMLDEGQKLLELKLRQGLPKGFRIMAAGGQHRLTALQDWYAKKKASLAECKKQEEAVLSADTDSITTDDIERMNTKDKVDQQTLEGILAYSSQWLVVLYVQQNWICVEDNMTQHPTYLSLDHCICAFPSVSKMHDMKDIINAGVVCAFLAAFVLHELTGLSLKNFLLTISTNLTLATGKMVKTLALHISWNEMKHVYVEPPMERLIQVYKIISVIDKDFRDISDITHIKGNPAKQSNLLHLDYVWDMMSFFDAAGTHYWHSDIMKFTQFYNMMTSSYGGIPAYLVQKFKKWLYLCFNAVELDSSDMDDAIDAIKRDPEDKSTQQNICHIYLQLRSAMPILDAISSGMRNVFHEGFAMTILHSPALDHFGNPSSPQWVTAYAQYTDHVPKISSKPWINVEIWALSSLSSLTLQSLSGVVQEGLMTLYRGFFMVVAIHILPKVFLQEWSPGSASADMIWAIMGHPSILLKRHSAVCDEVISTLFHHYPAYINMVSSLTHLTMPPHYIKQSELLAAFGSRSTAVSEKGKGKTANNGFENGEHIPDEDKDDSDAKPDVQDKEADTDMQLPDLRDQHAVHRQKVKDESLNHIPSLQQEIQDVITILTSSAKGHSIPMSHFTNHGLMSPTSPPMPPKITFRVNTSYHGTHGSGHLSLTPLISEISTSSLVPLLSRVSS
ncbi:hypothetical protein F5141DRAFT_1066787 [Pisolithus sp. B1]|nr:hypothetical protein F5141DRAFT_1066787 [Pisolithus sp. B1]